MIKNERQYRISRAQAERFVRALKELEEGPRQETLGHPVLKKAQKDALRSQLVDLEAELREYETLRTGRFDFDQLETIAELPATLIRARIARGYSQRDLADLLGLKEQQVQRYEATEYSSASLARIRDVVSALGVHVDGSLLIGEGHPSLSALIGRVSKVGLSTDFIEKRLVPRRVSALAHESGDQLGQALINSVAEVIGKVFNWTPKQLLTSPRLEFEPASGSVRFKMPANANQERVSAYAVYAHYLSLLVAQACSHLPIVPLPTDPTEYVPKIHNGSRSLALEDAVNMVWDLGVPVLPLDDPGTFHGACFREQGRNVIVLKQRSSSESRWAFDLFHELWHAGQEPELAERTVLELEETSPERRGCEEERIASIFAAQVLLGGRAPELAQICLLEANGDLRRLKSAVQKVADKEEVSVAALGNYLAFRLSAEQGQNWWASASSLQPTGQPWKVVRDVFFERANFASLAPPDRELLAQALTPWEDTDHA